MVMGTHVGGELAGLVVAAEAVALTGDVAVATELYETLRSHEGTRIPAARPEVAGASVGYYLALLARTGGRLDAALDHLERALALHLEAREQGWVARVRCELARVLLARGDEASRRRARVELDAVRSWPGSAASALGDEATGLLARAERAADVGLENVIQCQGEFWTIAFAGRVCHVRDTRGLHCLAVLLRHPWQEFPVLALEDASDGGTRTLTTSPVEPLVLERARVRVTRGLQNAIARITACHAELGRHLASTVRTGGVCSYVPDSRLPVKWTT